MKYRNKITGEINDAYIFDYAHKESERPQWFNDYLKDQTIQIFRDHPAHPSWIEIRIKDGILKANLGEMLVHFPTHPIPVYPLSPDAIARFEESWDRIED